MTNPIDAASIPVNPMQPNNFAARQTRFLLKGATFTLLTGVSLAALYTSILLSGRDYTFGDNKASVEYKENFFTAPDLGSTTIRYADGTKTNFPYEMTQSDIISVLLKNPKQSKLSLTELE